MGKPYQSLALLFTAVTAIVTVYNYLRQDEHRDIQKKMDKYKLAEMEKKIASGLSISDPLPS